MQRRDFLSGAGSCAAHLALAATLPPSVTRDWIRPRGRVVAAASFAVLEEIAEGIWAVISNPLEGDRATLSNGGLIAGSAGVLAVEGFYTPEGAAWLTEQSRALTGRTPTHVAVTHYHADHANGVAGYFRDSRPVVRATDVTRDLVLARNTPADPARAAALGGASLVDAAAPGTVDLGDRQVRIVPQAGHTPSDIALVVEDPHVVFCGDLVWNGMFPNYVDAVPSVLAQSVDALRGGAETVYVPGHGPLARAADFERYVIAIRTLEEAARAAHAAGRDADAAGAEFTLPSGLGEWVLFGRTYFQRAFHAWYRELSA